VDNEYPAVIVHTFQKLVHQATALQRKLFEDFHT